MPNHEKARLKEVQRSQILDSDQHDVDFDRYTSLACRSLKVPISAIKIMDADRIWCKSMVNMPYSELPRDLAICSSLMLEHSPKVLLCHDLSQDFNGRHAAHPNVCGPPFLRFYAACAIICNGMRFGVIAVMDTVTKTKDEKRDSRDLSILEDLADLIADLIAEKRFHRWTLESTTLANLIIKTLLPMQAPLKELTECVKEFQLSLPSLRATTTLQQQNKSSNPRKVRNAEILLAKERARKINQRVQVLNQQNELGLKLARYRSPRSFALSLPPVIQQLYDLNEASNEGNQEVPLRQRYPLANLKDEKPTEQQSAWESFLCRLKCLIDPPKRATQTIHWKPAPSMMNCALIAGFMEMEKEFHSFISLVNAILNCGWQEYHDAEISIDIAPVPVPQVADNIFLGASSDSFSLPSTTTSTSCTSYYEAAIVDKQHTPAGKLQVKLTFSRNLSQELSPDTNTISNENSIIRSILNESGRAFSLESSILKSTTSERREDTIAWFSVQPPVLTNYHDNIKAHTLNKISTSSNINHINVRTDNTNNNTNYINNDDLAIIIDSTGSEHPVDIHDYPTHDMLYKTVDKTSDCSKHCHEKETAVRNRLSNNRIFHYTCRSCAYFCTGIVRFFTSIIAGWNQCFIALSRVNPR